MPNLRISFVCGVVPLLLGTALFLSWLFTEAMWWERAWLWGIGLGIVCVLTGAVFLGRHLSRQRPAAPRDWFLPGLAAVTLLLNIPVAALYLSAAVTILTRYTVEVQNHTTQPVDSFLVSGAGLSGVELGPVPGGQGTRRHLRFDSQGKLTFMARQGVQEHQGVLEASASPDSGGGKIAILQANGTWDVIPGHRFGK